MDNATDQPIYILSQKKSRIIIPKLMTFILLGTVFYLVILLNISLLKLDAQQETIIKTTSLIILLSIIALGTYLTFHRSHRTYKFYQKGIFFNKNFIDYTSISSVEKKQNLSDKIFKTYHLKLSPNFQIKNIPNEVDVQNYLQQLIQYTKTNIN